MKLKKTPFQPLPFSDLFQTYVAGFEKLAGFYETNPFDFAPIRKYAENIGFTGDRKKAAELLLQFNRQFKVHEKAIVNIERLKSDNALVLVTGQQLGLFGGPLYTFYKTLTVIHLARRFEGELKRPVIPVFWLADEDHDFDEVKSINVLGTSGLNEFSLPDDHTSKPVSQIAFPSELDGLKGELKEGLIDTDFSANLWELIDTCFKPGETFLNGFGTFISNLFSKHGLVLAGSNNEPVKAFTKDVIIQSVKKHKVADEALSEQTERLKSVFHQQVTLNSSHLFYISEEDGRIKINRNKKDWQTDSGKIWSDEELVKEIENQPEKFSPDVFLRPVLQDKLLPTLGYIAGPGEIAYYGQMKSFYEVFEMKMPVIFPRLSAAFIEPAIDRILRELPFKISDYQQRIENLEQAFAKQVEEVNIESTFKKWKEGVEELQQLHTNMIVNIDETLEGASKKAQAYYFNELDKLKGKTYQAIKKNEKIQVKRIHRIQNNLFPNRELQERVLSGIYYMNKFGIDIWDRLLENLDDDINLSEHKLIYL